MRASGPVSASARYTGAAAMLIVMLGMLLGYASPALAKPVEIPAADPPVDAVVLNVSIGGVILPYTWGDLTGARGYRFAGKTQTYVYPRGGAADECEGIGFSDLLADVESTLGINLQDDCLIRAIAVDGSQSDAFSAGEARDYARNHYLLANRVNGTSEAALSCADAASSAAYAASYLRVVRSRGSATAADASGDTASMRLIGSLHVTRADGSAVVLPEVTLAPRNGADLSGLSPATTGLVIGGTGIDRAKGLLGTFVYLDQAQVDFIKATRSVAGLGLGESWTNRPVLYSAYHNHGIPEYTYILAEGIDLRAALSALGVDVTSAPLAVEAVAIDYAYAQIVSDAFGKKTGRNYIAPDGTVGAAVGPLLVFYDDEVSTTAHPDPTVALPTAVKAIAESNPLFVYGQTQLTESNHCGYVKNTCKVRAGSDAPALKVTEGSATKTISLSDMALMGIYRTSYYWSEGDAHFTHSLVGVPLADVLPAMGFALSGGQDLVVMVDGGSGAVASQRTISAAELDRCFVAYDAFESGRRVEGSVRPLRIYCPGGTRAEVMIENVVGVTLSAAGSFTDLPADLLAGYGVTVVQLSGISSGYDDGSFRPGQNIPRAQFVKLAGAAFGVNQATPASATFTDSLH